MMKTSILSIILLLIIMLSGCEKAMMEDDPANTPHKNFEFLWETIDERYSFFLFKDVDWDAVYDEYKKKIYPEMTDQELFNVLANMLNELKDGHVNIKAPFNRSRYWGWMLNYPPNFDYNIIERNYLGKDHWITGPFKNTIIDSIGYMYYGSFQGTVRDVHIDTIISRFSGLKGMIIDVRDNGGGSTTNGDRIVSRFVHETTPVGIRMYKNGPEHDNFSDPIVMSVKPGGEKQYPQDKPVVILMNRGCYSAANDFIMKMDAISDTLGITQSGIIIPRITLMGDKSGGGGGLPVYSELPIGWRFRYSSTITLTLEKTLSLEKRNVEDGIEPDIRIGFPQNAGHTQRDTIIETALDYINELPF